MIAEHSQSTDDQKIADHGDCYRARQQRRKWILRGAPVAVLQQLSAPMLCAVLALFAADLFELYIASRLGPDQLSALSFTLPLQGALSALAIGLGIVVATPLSQALGRNQPKCVEALAAAGMLFTGLLGLALTLLLLWGLEPLMMFLGLVHLNADEASLLWGLIEPYMDLRLAGLVCYLLVLVVFGALRALGNMRAAAQLLVAFSVLQMALAGLSSWQPLQQWLQLPGLSALGAAHLLASVLAAAYALWLLRRAERLTGFSKAFFNPSRRHLLALVRLLPAVASMQLMTPLALALLMSVVAQQGSEAIAVYGVILRLEPLALLLPMVLTTSLPVFVGQNWAAQRPRRIRAGIQLALLVCLLWQLCVALGLFFSADAIGSGFCRYSAISGGISQALKVLPLSYAVLALVMVYVSSCNAMGRSDLALTITAVRLFLLSLPMAVIGAQLNGMQGLIAGLALANVTVAALFLLFPGVRLAAVCADSRMIKPAGSGRAYSADTANV